ncbi:MAG: glycosyltransferase family 2 protein [Caenispirillum sp.]|nr:glycosyltransferase family 2 protein [Caenispirillum sp.]
MSTQTLTASARPVLSIIIVNWMVRDLLRQCLRSLETGTSLPEQAREVVVVDNASHDGSVEMLRREFPAVRLLANEDNVGFGAANNQALPYCSAEWILLLNPDTVVLPGAIDAMLASARADESIGVLGCRLLNGDGTLQKWTGGHFPNLANLLSHYFFLDRLLPAALRPPSLYLDRDVREDLTVDWVSGACMLLRRSALGERIFDPAYFMYGEDMELCHRLRRQGYRVLYSPAASVIHFQGQSMKQQEGDILLSSLKGPRQFYRATHDEAGTLLFDLITLGGFLLRWAVYSLAAWPGRQAVMRERARSSLHYARIVMRLMVQGGKP